jgi:hypothetical protein
MLSRIYVVVVQYFKDLDVFCVDKSCTRATVMTILHGKNKDNFAYYFSNL